MQDLLTTILAFAFALGVIIIVHESGHLLVAKAFGIRVLTFSIGFGTKLVSFRRGDTEYRLSAVPVGGYVRLGGESPEDSHGDDRDFTVRPRWQRILVYLAGPSMNLLLAILLFASLFMVGIEVPNLPKMPSLIGSVAPGSSAAAARLQRGDLILELNGEKTPSWQELSLALITSPGRAVHLLVQRGTTTFAAEVTPKRIPKEDAGDFAGLYPMVRPQVTDVLRGKPAEKAGFRAGDEIRAVDGVPIADSRDFVAAIEKRAGQQVLVEILRGSDTLALTVVPQSDGKAGRIGVTVGFFQRYPPGQALVESVHYSVQIVRDTFAILGKISRREMSAKSAFAGPIEIAVQSGAQARAGFKYLLHLMGWISISIALLNLMPIPILDGGQIFILLVEEVIRRDLSLRVKEVISQVGFVLILMLMMVVLYFDVMKHLPFGLGPQ
jgi:regulator of sigma E protease